MRDLFKQYVHGLLRMAENLRLMLGANRNFRVALDGPPEVRELARAANDLAQQRDELLNDVEAQIDQAKATVEEEKNRLAALMSELALGVVVCNLDGRILLYNSRARLQFKALAQGPTAMSGGALIGLGRSIFSVLERGQITHSLENIQQRLRRGSAAPTANFITTHARRPVAARADGTGARHGCQRLRRRQYKWTASPRPPLPRQGGDKDGSQAAPAQGRCDCDNTLAPGCKSPATC